MRARHFVIQGFADVVEQAAFGDDHRVGADFLGEHASQVRHLHAVLQDILAVARAEAKAADDFEELLRVPGDPEFLRRALAELEHHFSDLFLHFGDDLLDPGRLDAPVLNQFLHRELRDVTASEVVAGDHDCARRVVDDDVHARGLFKRDDISAFLADDLPLHVIGRELHHGRRRFARHFGGVALHGLGQEVLRLLLGFLFDVFPSGSFT